MSYSQQISLILFCILAFCLSNHGTYAFGAGNIPSYAYMEGKAFRHGDIEDTLGELAKQAGGFALGALIGRGGSKFSPLDIKRVYFGNWLRDYSQAVDVAGLSKLQLQTIVNLCMLLGFMAHGYATGEFEVTIERLGVYLPTEHIDNPRGYPDNAQQYDRRLRGRVDPRELDIDHRTGMKNYIANEQGHWDTSRALVRRTLERCIQMGRQYRAHGRNEDKYEAYRLLGQALHTLEDFPAHSNFCELALAAMGHNSVYVHVGDQVRIKAPDGEWVAPLVTGTFGSSDFIHSLLGEATDHISQASVTDLNAGLQRAEAKSAMGNGSDANLRSLLSQLPNGTGGEMTRELDGVERVRAGARAPDNMTPQEIHAVVWQVLTFRDNVMKKVTVVIEKIPGLGALLEKINDSIQVFVFTTLEPFIKPIMKQATAGLMAASGEVIDKEDQYEVFDNPHASDPTHSFLSKDHFALILNEPAGHLAKIIVAHTVKRVVKAWEDSSINVHSLTEDVLQCMFHPDFYSHSSQIQREMMEYMRSWVRGLDGRQHDVLGRLTKDGVRNHRNVRGAADGGPPITAGTLAQNLGVGAQHEVLADVPGAAQASSLIGKINDIGPGASQLYGKAQGVMGKLSPRPGIGVARTTATTPGGTHYTEVEEVSTTPSVPAPEASHGAHHAHHGHHVHSGAYESDAPLQRTAYYDSQTISMPSESVPPFYASPEPPHGAHSGHHGHHHHHAHHHAPSAGAYEPPLGPPPSFPSAEPVGVDYNTGYPSAYGQGPESGYPGYGYAPTYGPPRLQGPPPPQAGPGFPEAFPPPPFGQAPSGYPPERRY